MTNRSPKARAASMRGFYERSMEDVDRDEKRLAEYLRNAERAKERDDPVRENEWNGYANRLRTEIDKKRRSLESIKRTVDKLESEADPIGHSQEQREAAE